MTDKQFRYIVDICPQTIECGKYIIKPILMSKKLKTLPNSITQNIIKLGKAWRQWCELDNELTTINVIRNNKYLSFCEYESLEVIIIQLEICRKEMNELKIKLEMQLDDIGWAEYKYNLDKEVLL